MLPRPQHLEPWVQSTDEQERSRAMECLLELLKAYLDFSNTNEASTLPPLTPLTPPPHHSQAARELAVQGQLLGRMIPRCSDPSLAIRQMAIDCIQLTLRIATCTPGEGVFSVTISPQHYPFLLPRFNSQSPMF